MPREEALDATLEYAKILWSVLTVLLQLLKKMEVLKKKFVLIQAFVNLVGLIQKKEEMGIVSVLKEPRVLLVINTKEIFFKLNKTF
jgi:hypothetical protein